MEEKHSSAQGEETTIAPDRHHITQVRRRFEQLSALRLKRLKSVLLPAQRQFLDILPALLHCNHPVLPGYAPQSTPSGIHDYRISPETRQILERRFPAFKPADSHIQKLSIQGLYLMGSSGTLAQNINSDLDCWVCLEHAADTETRKALQEKCAAISEWASRFRLELHFFIMHDESFQQKLRANMSIEDCGETQHYLLLDEFYRTAIPLAGRAPLWWLTPCDSKLERDAKTQADFYQDYRAVLTDNRFIKKSDYLDFGDTGVIPIREYLSASVWTLYKAIQSPYKAVIKLMLLESYVVQHGAQQNLSDQLKAYMHGEDVDIESLDPYLQIYKHIENYLRETGQAARLDVLRRCFYRKIDIKVSRLSTSLIERIRSDAPPARINNRLKTSNLVSQPNERAKKRAHKDHSNLAMWRHKLLLDVLDEWGWDADRIAREDDIRNWPISEQLQERRDIDRELIAIYRFLDHTAKQLLNNDEYQAHRASPEMRLLERQLKVVFRHSRFKIGYRVADIDTRLVKQPARALAIHLDNDQTATGPGQGNQNSAQHKRWILSPVDETYSRRSINTNDNVVSINNEKPTAIYTAKTLEQIVLWSLLNGLADKSTSFTVNTGRKNTGAGSLSKGDIQLDKIARQAQEFIAQGFGSDNAIRQLNRDPEVTRCMVLINSRPANTDSSLWDRVVLSERDDPLSYTGVPHNLVEQLSITWENDWGEIFHRQFVGHDAIQHGISFYLSLNRSRFCGPNVQCVSAQRTAAVTKRVQQLFDDATNWLDQKTENADTENTEEHRKPKAFVFTTADGLYAVTAGGDAHENETLHFALDRSILDTLQNLSKRWKLMLDAISIGAREHRVMGAKSLLG